MDFLGFFGLAEGDGEELAIVDLSDCPLPARYEDWPEAERETSLEETIPVSDNRFRVLLHSQKPKWAQGSLGQVPQYGRLSRKIISRYILYSDFTRAVVC
tara:strand:+ start:578 stop:877 length:300 start_codon:yes stop_codon:yes gene_type:complete